MSRVRARIPEISLGSQLLRGPGCPKGVSAEPPETISNLGPSLSWASRSMSIWTAAFLAFKGVSLEDRKTEIIVVSFSAS